MLRFLFVGSLLSTGHPIDETGGCKTTLQDQSHTASMVQMKVKRGQSKPLVDGVEEGVSFNGEAEAAEDQMPAVDDDKDDLEAKVKTTMLTDVANKGNPWDGIGGKPWNLAVRRRRTEPPTRPPSSTHQYVFGSAPGEERNWGYSLCPSSHVPVADVAACRAATAALRKRYGGRVWFWKEVSWNGNPHGCVTDTTDSTGRHVVWNRGGYHNYSRSERVCARNTCTAKFIAVAEAKRCEDFPGYTIIDEVEECAAAARALGKRDADGKVTAKSYQRQCGCTWHPFGNVELWKPPRCSPTKTCTADGYAGCLCKCAQTPASLVSANGRNAAEDQVPPEAAEDDEDDPEAAGGQVHPVQENDAN